MKARKENDGQIKIYRVLPSKFRGLTGNYAGGFHLVNEEILKKEGFFDVVIPEYNKLTEILSDIYLDEENEIYTYDVSLKPDLPTIEKAKIDKIKELKINAKDKLAETDWYYIRELHTKKKGVVKEVPEEIISGRESIYSQIDKKEEEINMLTELEEVLAFDTGLDSAETISTAIEETLVEEETDETPMEKGTEEKDEDEVVEEEEKEETPEEEKEENPDEEKEETLEESADETKEETQNTEVPEVENPVLGSKEEEKEEENTIPEIPKEEPEIKPEPEPEIKPEPEPEIKLEPEPEKETEEGPLDILARAFSKKTLTKTLSRNSTKKNKTLAKNSNQRSSRRA